MKIEQLETQLLEAARADLDIPAETLARGEANLLAAIGGGGNGGGGGGSGSGSGSGGSASAGEAQAMPNVGMHPGAASSAGGSGTTAVASTSVGTAANATASASIAGGSVWGTVALATVLLAGGAATWLTTSSSESPAARRAMPARATEQAHREKEATIAPLLPTEASKPAENPRPPPAIEAVAPPSPPPNASRSERAERTRPSPNQPARAPSAQQQASKGAAKPSAAPSLAQQLELLQLAGSAAERGQGKLAVQLTQQLKELESRTLREEVLATEVLALCAAQQAPQARAAYRQFVVRFPGSLYTRRLQSSCASGSE